MIVARAHPQVPTDDGWRGRVRAVAERGARAVVSRSIAALSERDGVLGAEVLLLVPGGEESTAARAADGVLREMEAGSDRVHVCDRAQPHRRGSRRPAAGRQRGAAGGERRAGLRRRGGARLRADRRLPAAAVGDERESHRSCSASTPRRSSRWWPTTSSTRPTWCGRSRPFWRPTATSRARPSGCSLTATRSTTAWSACASSPGLDVSSSDGREKLSLGLKSMRVLGISSADGPASEAGAEGGRVPRRPGSRRS